MAASKNQTTEELGLPRIAHVEVGGSVGGSLLKLCDYLTYCDRQIFHREVIFYRRPPGSEAILDGRCLTIDLGFKVPPMSGPADRRRRQKARVFVNSHPRLRNWTSLMRGGWQLLTGLPEAFSLAKEFRRRKYDLIHCNNSFTYQVPTILAARLARKPLVCHFRTIRKLTRWELWLSRIPISVVPICQTIADDLKQQGVRTLLTTCYDPWEKPKIPWAKSKTLRNKLLQDGTILVGTVSRLEDLKGIEDFLAAACLLRRRQPDVRYVIVGDGSKADALKELAIKLDLGDRLYFVGFQQNVVDYYLAMDIFVCPSLMEGAQAVLLEAMMTGLPAVATRVGWASELIRNYENGLLVNTSEPESLARAIESLIVDPQRRRQMGSRSQQSVLHLSDPSAQAKKIDALFLRAMRHELHEKASGR